MCIVTEFKSIFRYPEILLSVIASPEVGGHSGYTSARREKHAWCMRVAHESHTTNLAGKSWQVFSNKGQ